MPKVGFLSENKVAQNDSIPTLKLKHGERALIVCIEPEPTSEYVHTLRAPAIGPDGRVIKEEKEKKNGDTYLTPKMDFFGQHLCFGDFDVLADKGVDPANCPSCRAADEGTGVELAKPYYAMHVIRYALQPNSWQVREPYSVELIPWKFAANRFNTLVDLALDAGDLRKHDLKLGPCTNDGFQKYDIQISVKDGEWMANPARKSLTLETYKSNQLPDLSAVIGRRIDKPRVIDDIKRVLERFAEANNASTAPAVEAPVHTAAAATQEIATTLDDLATVPAEAASSGEDISFDELMSGL
jgi:hypothetical protein